MSTPDPTNQSITQPEADYAKGYQDGLAKARSGDVGGGFFGRDRSEDYKKGFEAGVSAGLQEAIQGSR